MDINGKHVRCERCEGKGLKATWSTPDECDGCGGSGQVWRYESGVLARWYGGPLLGAKDASHA